LNDYLNPNVDLYNGHFYRALRKYGIENFTFQIVELCVQSDLDDREIYWIGKYDSFTNGYNETLGGKAKSTVDRLEFEKYYIEHAPSVKEIAEVFDIDRSTAGRIMSELKLQPKFYVTDEEKDNIISDYLNTDLNVGQLARKYNRSPDTISNVLHKNGIEIIRKKNLRKIIDVYDISNGNLILSKVSIPEFMRYLIDNNINRKPLHSTILASINRKSKALYDKYRVELIKEREI